MKRRGIDTQKIDIPSISKLLDSSKNYDYSDSYQAIYIDTEDNISAADMGKAFFKSGPKWSTKLFELRNRIVSVLGLKTPGDLNSREEMLQNFKCETGERLGLFRVYSSDENEVILGEDDKHLDFRVSLLKGKNTDNEKTITLSTTVVFNNWFGKLYFLPVKPFHKLIVPKMLKGVVYSIEDN